MSKLRQIVFLQDKIMKFPILFLLLLFVPIVGIKAQSPTTGNSNPADETSRKLRQKGESNRRFEALKSVGEYSRNIKNWITDGGDSGCQ